MLRYTFLLVVLSFCSLFAESSVWRISKDGQSLYLGGTCHVLRPTDYPIPAEFEMAYSLADKLVFEMDPSLAEDPNFSFKLIKESSYDRKLSLKSTLSKKTYKALSEKCDQTGFSIETLNKTKPGFVIMMLMVEEMTRLGVTEEGVDLYFHKRCLNDKKEVLGLETPEFQIDLITSLGEGMEDKIITYGLKDLKNLELNFDMLVTAWKKGDLSKIDTHFVQNLRKYPKLYNKLLVDRNKRWISYLEAYMYTPGTKFVLVGAAHLAGKEGLINLLQKKGYTIEQISVPL